MGEVYRATDTSLKRQVAIKVLPGAFAGDPDRLARFQREAQLLASLNHPNIGGIYGLESRQAGRLRAEGAPASLAEARDGTSRAVAGQASQAGQAEGTSGSVPPALPAP